MVKNKKHEKNNKINNEIAIDIAKDNFRQVDNASKNNINKQSNHHNKKRHSTYKEVKTNNKKHIKQSIDMVDTFDIGSSNNESVSNESVGEKNVSNTSIESMRVEDMQVINIDHEKDQIQKDRYNLFVKSITPQTSILKSLWHSFLIGGLVCVFGQVLAQLFFLIPSVDLEQSNMFSLLSLVVIAIFLTGIGVYDDFARVGGAGLFLPITGFANAMSSASMESKTEGLVFGTAVKMFTIVGPVIVNGVVWSTIAGLLYYIVKVFIIKG